MLDSIADDLNLAAAIVGVYVLDPDFFVKERVTILILAGLYLAQNALALIKYHQLTTFHTYLAKIAAVLQGVVSYRVLLSRATALLAVLHYGGSYRNAVG